MCMFCTSLFVLFLLTIVLYVLLRYRDCYLQTRLPLCRHQCLFVSPDLHQNKRPRPLLLSFWEIRRDSYISGNSSNENKVTEKILKQNQLSACLNEFCWLLLYVFYWLYLMLTIILVLLCYIYLIVSCNVSKVSPDCSITKNVLSFLYLSVQKYCSKIRLLYHRIFKSWRFVLHGEFAKNEHL